MPSVPWRERMIGTHFDHNMVLATPISTTLLEPYTGWWQPMETAQYNYKFSQAIQFSLGKTSSSTGIWWNIPVQLQFGIGNSPQFGSGTWVAQTVPQSYGAGDTFGSGNSIQFGWCWRHHWVWQCSTVWIWEFNSYGAGDTFGSSNSAQCGWCWRHHWVWQFRQVWVWEFNSVPVWIWEYLPLPMNMAKPNSCTVTLGKLYIHNLTLWDCVNY